jgi:hypothetical protein
VQNDPLKFWQLIETEKEKCKLSINNEGRNKPWPIENDEIAWYTYQGRFSGKIIDWENLSSYLKNHIENILVCYIERFQLDLANRGKLDQYRFSIEHSFDAADVSISGFVYFYNSFLMLSQYSPKTLNSFSDQTWKKILLLLLQSRERLAKIWECASNTVKETISKNLIEFIEKESVKHSNLRLFGWHLSSELTQKWNEIRQNPDRIKRYPENNRYKKVRDLLQQKIWNISDFVKNVFRFFIETDSFRLLEISNNATQLWAPVLLREDSLSKLWDNLNEQVRDRLITIWVNFLKTIVPVVDAFKVYGIGIRYYDCAEFINGRYRNWSYEINDEHSNQRIVITNFLDLILEFNIQSDDLLPIELLKKWSALLFERALPELKHSTDRSSENIVTSSEEKYWSYLYQRMPLETLKYLTNKEIRPSNHWLNPGFKYIKSEFKPFPSSSVYWWSRKFWNEHTERQLKKWLSDTSTDIISFRFLLWLGLYKNLKIFVDIAKTFASRIGLFEQESTEYLKCEAAMIYLLLLDPNSAWNIFKDLIYRNPVVGLIIILKLFFFELEEWNSQNSSFSNVRQKFWSRNLSKEHLLDLYLTLTQNYDRLKDVTAIFDDADKLADPLIANCSMHITQDEIDFDRLRGFCTSCETELNRWIETENIKDKYSENYFKQINFGIKELLPRFANWYNWSFSKQLLRIWEVINNNSDSDVNRYLEWGKINSCPESDKWEDHFDFFRDVEESVFKIKTCWKNWQTSILESFASGSKKPIEDLTLLLAKISSKDHNELLTLVKNGIESFEVEVSGGSNKYSTWTNTETKWTKNTRERVEELIGYSHNQSTSNILNKITAIGTQQTLKRQNLSGNLTPDIIANLFEDDFNRQHGTLKTNFAQEVDKGINENLRQGKILIDHAIADQASNVSGVVRACGSIFEAFVREIARWTDEKKQKHVKYFKPEYPAATDTPVYKHLADEFKLRSAMAKDHFNIPILNWIIQTYENRNTWDMEGHTRIYETRTDKCNTPVVESPPETSEAILVFEITRAILRFESNYYLRNNSINEISINEQKTINLRTRNILALNAMAKLCNKYDASFDPELIKWLDNNLVEETSFLEAVKNSKQRNLISEIMISLIYASNWIKKIDINI